MNQAESGSAMLEWLANSHHSKLSCPQGLLSIAIYCGQPELAQLLVKMGCDHSSLTAADLNANIPDGLYSWGAAAEHEDKRALIAARVAFAACDKHVYSVLLLQMAGWWSRGADSICV